MKYITINCSCQAFERSAALLTLLADVHQKVRPLLLILNTRPLAPVAPKEYTQIADAPESQVIKLDALLLVDVEALVCQRLGVGSIPPEVSNLIREKSEGHPFFAEELAYALRDTGALVIENDAVSGSLIAPRGRFASPSIPGRQ